MLVWLRDLTSRERRTMLACWGGWTLDGFDQQLYSYVVPTIIALWGMSTGIRHRARGRRIFTGTPSFRAIPANGNVAPIAAIRRSTRTPICREADLALPIRLASTEDSLSYGARGSMGGSLERRSPSD